MAIQRKFVGSPVAWAALAPLLLSACATSPEVKLASTQMTAALQDLRTANRVLQRAYVGEIRRTQADIEKAVVARFVSLRVGELSSALEGPEWTEEFRATGLIALSREIEITQGEARALARLVSEEAGAGEDAPDLDLSALIRGRMGSLRTSAAALREQGMTEEAGILERRSDEVAAALSANCFQDPMVRAYLVALRDLAAMASTVPRSMKELDDLVNMLRATHSVIHRWVMTDVRPSGAMIGGLLEKHAQLVGLGSSNGGGGSR